MVEIPNQTTGHESGDLSIIIAEVTGADGMVEIVSRVLKGQYTAGYQSPASAYGEELLETLMSVKIIDL